MKIKIQYCLILFMVFTINSQEDDIANHLITLFIKQYPTNNVTNIQASEAIELCKLLNCSVGKILPNAGIFSLYAGYLSISDQNGQIIFPRKTVKDSLNIVVAEKVSPVFMFRNTIAFWKIRAGSPAKIYSVERKFDKTSESFFWNVTEKQIPLSQKISLHSIIILANPDDIYVPLGITITNNNAQLILPPIYAKNSIQHVQNSLFALNIKPFYSKIEYLFNERPLGYIMQLKV